MSGQGAQGRKFWGDIFFGVALVSVFLVIFIDARLWLQTSGIFLTEGVVDSILTSFTEAIIVLMSLGGTITKWGLLLLRLISFSAYLIYIFYGQPSGKDEKPSPVVYIAAYLSSAGFLLMFFLSPFFTIASGNDVSTKLSILSIVLTMSFFLLLMYSVGAIGRWIVYGGADSMKQSVEDDPFGYEERLFNQTVELVENKYSVNVPYTFKNAKGIFTKGWINFVNIFRAVIVLGTPGSGKSYTFFLSAIEQLMNKGFTFLVYDFKYKELSEYTYNCYMASLSKIKEKMNGIIPTFHVITFDNIFESERCNVLQPQLLEDFTIDAFGASNIFLSALNRTWANKEGDFFPESAKNITAASFWALKRYKGGRYCTLPHAIEFLSMDTEHIIRCLIAMKDNSLSNVVRPFEQAFNKEAMEQLNGQMGSVQIPLSRLTSPKVYWILTEAEGQKPFSLELNDKQNPKILCLGSSGKNQMINNIFFSLLIAQIFRLVNVKGRWPLAVLLDEVTTLSFPKGTLDVLIQTARSNLISVWLGFQDLSLLIRDFTKDIAEALFKMCGNIVSGNVHDDTGQRMQDRIGKLRYIKKSISMADGEPKPSFSEQEGYAVPMNYFSQMSQGTFAGQLADNFDQKLKTKVFFGEATYEPPFQKDAPAKIRRTPFWEDVFENHCKGLTEEQTKEYVDGILQRNFDQIRKDVLEMKNDLIGE